jgi:MFS family permease
MGTWMQNVAQNWLIYKMTNNDPRYLGWMGLAFAIPMIVLPPVGGYLADRFPRARILQITQWSMLMLALIQALLTFAELNSPWLILVATFLNATLLAVDNPTRQALIPTLVPRSDLMNALALNSATYNGAALVGPALAGFLLGTLGAGWLFLGNAMSFVAVIYAVSHTDRSTARWSTLCLHPQTHGGIVVCVNDYVYLWAVIPTGVTRIC